MKKLLAIVCAAGLASCANLYRYEKPDAAMVSRMCGFAPSLALDGKRYVTEAGITAVDGHLPGTGVSCRGNPIHRINPDAKRLTFFVLYQEPDSRYATMAYPQLDVQLRPTTSYSVETSFDGKTVRLILKDSHTGTEIAQTETTDIKLQSTSNAALAVIPLILK